MLLGSVAVAATCRRTAWLVIPIGIDLIVLLLLGFTGSRYILILTAISTLVVLAKFRGRGMNIYSLLFIPAILGVVTALRMLRDGLQVSWESLLPLNSIYEMGSSLRPLAETIRLHQLGKFEWSMEYVNGFSLWLLREFSLLSGAAQSKDYYGFGPELMHQYFGLEHRFGWSMMAEIYVDYTPVVAMAFAACCGALLIFIDRAGAGTDVGALLTLAFCVPLLFAVRQPVTQIAPHFLAFSIIGVSIIVASFLVSRIAKFPWARAR